MDRKLYWIGAFIMLALMFIATMVFVQNNDNQSAKQPQKTEQNFSSIEQTKNNSPSNVDEIIRNSKTMKEELKRAIAEMQNFKEAAGIECSLIIDSDECRLFIKNAGDENMINAFKRIREANIRIVIASDLTKNIIFLEDGTILIPFNINPATLKSFLGVK